MSSEMLARSYIAQPPLLLGQGAGPSPRAFVEHLLRSFGRTLIQPLIPFNPQPEVPLDPPEPRHKLDDKTVERCREIYNAAESSRTYLEGKARSAFTLIAFMVPLLISAFAFVVKESAQSGAKTFVICLAGVTGLLLVLAFISVARAVSVQPRQELHLGSVIDADKADFYLYDSAHYARGLLYCASMNVGMNAHIAQFVKGAHVLTTVAVLLISISAVPLMFLFTQGNSEPSHTVVDGPIKIVSPQLDIVAQRLVVISDNLQAIAERNRLIDENAQLLIRISRLEAQLKKAEGAALKQGKRNPSASKL